MKILEAFAAAHSAFKATWRLADGHPTVPDIWDRIAYGWDAFWATLGNWGGTSFSALAGAAAANPNAGRGLRLIAENGADLPLIAYRRKRAGGGGTADAEAPDPPALQAIHRTGWRNLFTPYVWGLYCGGEAFVHKLSPETGPNRGQPRRLRVLPNARFVRVERDAAGDPLFYHFRDRRGKPEKYAAAEVLHIRLPHPTDDERGLPILLSCRRALTLVEEADVWGRGLAKGGGRRPAYFRPVGLKPGDALDPETHVRPAQAASDVAHDEREGSNKPMFLNGAWEPFAAGVTPREAEAAKGRQVYMREIASTVGVSATLLADEKAGSLTDAGVDSEVAALLKLTIRPLVNLFLAELTGWLCADGERLDVDWDQVPALQESIDAKFKRYDGVNVLTGKEKRVALGYGAEPAKGLGDAPAAGDGGETGEVEEGAAVPELALNGAQVSSALDIVARVAAGQLPRESGLAMLVTFFSIAREQAEGVMGEVGRGFVPTSTPPLPAPAPAGGDGVAKGFAGPRELEPVLALGRLGDGPWKEILEAAG